MSTIETAIRIALEAHEGQVDKGGSPYILHPLRVMMGMDSDAERQAALLHDVVEDGGVSMDELRSAGFSEEVLTAVALLTKRRGEPYSEYLARVRDNPVARRVKLGDLADNMRMDRIPKPGPKDWERLEKYRRAVDFLRIE